MGSCLKKCMAKVRILGQVSQELEHLENAVTHSELGSPQGQQVSVPMLSQGFEKELGESAKAACIIPEMWESLLESYLATAGKTAVLVLKNSTYTLRKNLLETVIMRMIAATSFLGPCSGPDPC